MSKNYFQVVQKGLWKSIFFSELNIVGIAIVNSACRLMLLWFLTGVFGLGISYYKVTSSPDVAAVPANPAFALRNE